MEAKAYLQQKFPHSKMVFIVASDDRKWCQKMFAKEENMIMTKWDISPGLDLAILSQCNHSIIRFCSNSMNSLIYEPIPTFAMLFEFHINSYFIFKTVFNFISALEHLVFGQHI